MLAFGTYPEVSLAEARKRREEAKGLLANGVGPSEAKKAEKRATALNSSRTFEAIGREWFAFKLPGWVPGYAERLMSRLEADVFQPLGARPIADIEPPEVLDAIRKVEARGAIELAKREMQVVGQIFRFAIATGRAKRDPTQDLRGALKSPGGQKHYRALPKEDLPDFLQALAAYDGEPVTKLALRLMVVTFVPTTELRAARWVEFEGLDGPDPLWRIPPERMKMRFEHLVPLAPQAVAVLQELRPLEHGATEGERIAARSRAESIAKAAGLTLDAALSKLDAKPEPQYRNIFEGFDDWMEAKEPGYKAREAAKRAERDARKARRRAEVMALHGSEAALFARTEREAALNAAIAPLATWEHWTGDDGTVHRYADTLDGKKPICGIWGWDDVTPSIREAVTGAYPWPATLADTLQEVKEWDRLSWDRGLFCRHGEWTLACPY